MIIFNREPRDSSWTDQFLGACDHVHLLFPDRVQTGTEDVPLVEEAHNASAVGKSF